MAKLTVKKGAVTLVIFNIEMIKFTEKAVDGLTFDVAKDTSIAFGDEITVYEGATLRFTGNITNIAKPNIWKVTVMGCGWVTNNKWKMKVYTSESPEDIIKDLIDNNTGLTYSSTASSGVTIGKYIANNYISVIIEEMRRLLRWQIRTEPDKKFYFEPEGNVDNGVTWTTGTDIKIPYWKNEPSKFFNSVKVIGDFASYNKTETFNATAGQTDFVLAYKPIGSVKVTVAAVEKAGGAPGFGDFDILSEDKTIALSTGATVGQAVVITYTYQIPIVITSKNEDSIADTNLEIYKQIDAPYIKSFEDGRRLAKELLANHSSIESSCVAFRRSIDTSINIGEYITVEDTQRNITKKLVVKKIKITYPAGVTEVEFGENQSDVFDWQVQVMKRIQELEKKTVDEQTLMDHTLLAHNVDVTLTMTLTKKERAINDSGIWGHPTPANGAWGTAKWGGRHDAWSTF